VREPSLRHGAVRSKIIHRRLFSQAVQPLPAFLFLFTATSPRVFVSLYCQLLSFVSRSIAVTVARPSFDRRVVHSMICGPFSNVQVGGIHLGAGGQGRCGKSAARPKFEAGHGYSESVTH
jgi:hypothetical protein